MAKIHDKYVIELAEVIKGYGNDPDVEDPFELSLFYRFYELPNIAIQRENFLKMKPLETRKGKWIRRESDLSWWYECSKCGESPLYDPYENEVRTPFCPWCGAEMRGEEDETD